MRYYKQMVNCDRFVSKRTFKGANKIIVENFISDIHFKQLSMYQTLIAN